MSDFVPAVFARGGTSKGLFFDEAQLPPPGLGRNRVFLTAMGSPDEHGRQLNGMGGGLSSLSKVVMLGAGDGENSDLTYTFGQVDVDKPRVAYDMNCGNLAAAVGPVALELGLVECEDGIAALRIHATNTNQVIVSRFQVRQGRAVVEGDFQLPGVSGYGAPIDLEFRDPGGSLTSGLLPTGAARDTLEVDGVGAVEASLVDATNPVVFIRASSLGLSGTEPLDKLDGNDCLMAILERIRVAAGVRMGLAQSLEGVGPANPKIAVIAGPKRYTTLANSGVESSEYDLGIRMISMGKWHRAVTSTGALCAAVAADVTGSLPAEIRGAADPGPGTLRLGHPSGVVTVSGGAQREGSHWVASHAAVTRTARVLMRGEVAVQ